MESKVSNYRNKYRYWSEETAGKRNRMKRKRWEAGIFIRVHSLSTSSK